MKKTKLAKRKNKKILRPGRRTRDEISIGMTVDEKKAGMTYEEKLEGKGIPDLKKPVKADFSKNDAKLEFGNKETNVPSPKVLILKDQKTVQEVLNEELDKCTWEWEYVKIDKDFKLSALTKLGKEGWKFTFIHEPKALDPNSKQFSTICLQRPIKKGK